MPITILQPRGQADLQEIEFCSLGEPSGIDFVKKYEAANICWQLRSFVVSQDAFDRKQTQVDTVPAICRRIVGRASHRQIREYVSHSPSQCGRVWWFITSTSGSHRGSITFAGSLARV